MGVCRGGPGLRLPFLHFYPTRTWWYGTCFVVGERGSPEFIKISGGKFNEAGIAPLCHHPFTLCEESVSCTVRMAGGEAGAADGCRARRGRKGRAREKVKGGEAAGCRALLLPLPASGAPPVLSAVSTPQHAVWLLGGEHCRSPRPAADGTERVLAPPACLHARGCTASRWAPRATPFTLSSLLLKSEGVQAVTRTLCGQWRRLHVRQRRERSNGGTTRCCWRE